MELKNLYTISDLIDIAKRVRGLILKTTNIAGAGHTGGSLSEADILTALYFRFLNIDPKNPKKINRDRFVLSKGHATPGLYSVLSLRGFFPTNLLYTFDQTGSILQGHPDMLKTPGVDISSGSLGQGLSCSIGMALGGAANKLSYYCYTLLGDGECQEGQVWEAALFAGSKKVKRIITIIDYNKVQLSSKTHEALNLEPFRSKWEAFCWTVFECNGHDMQDLVETIEKAKDSSNDGPAVIIAHTVKGKGISFMENKWEWHGKAACDDEYAQALLELGIDQKELFK